MGEEDRVKDVYFFTDITKLTEACKGCNIEDFSGHDVLVKLHMGEAKNEYYPKPSFVTKILEVLKNYRASPYLYDTTVCYNAPRHTVEGYISVARSHGYSEETMGCEVIIDETGIDVTLEDISFKVASHLHDASFVFAISHVKGHNGAGMGGAIKNFGMGGVSQETKKWIHGQAKPSYTEDNCTFCGVCESVCPFNAIKVKDLEWSYDASRCFGCDACVQNCATDALEHHSGYSLQQLIAYAAKAGLEGKQVIYINELKRISRNCDCDPYAGPIICPDIGYLVSTDPVAIDAASLDLVYEQKPDIFKKESNIDPIDQIKYGEEIGLGTASYNLIEL